MRSRAQRRERSSAGAQCVSAPTDTNCTPVVAISRIVSSVTPPDASSSARPSTCAAAARNCSASCCRAGSAARPRQAPRRPPPIVGTRPRAAGPAARSSRAPNRLADAARQRGVVLLDQHRVVAARAVVGAAAARDRGLLESRSPGVVLRVSRILAPVPSTACTHVRGQRGNPGQLAEEVQRRALRGQDRARAPSIRSTGPPSRHCPSGEPLDRDGRVERCGTTSAARSSPKITPGAFCVIRPWPGRPPAPSPRS